MKPIRKPLFPCALATLAITGHSLQAALTWNPSGPNNLWSTSGSNTNWNPGATAWIQNESAVFNSGPEAIDVTTANTFNDITFDLSGFSITSGGSGSLILANDLASTITVSNAPDSASIGETIANNSAGASTLTKAGLGTLILNGTASSTYSGGTIVTAGNLVSNQGSNTALLGTGPISIGPSAILTLTKSASGDTSVANSITGTATATINATGTAGAIAITGDLSGFNGTLNLGTSGSAKINLSPSVPLPSGALVSITDGATLYAVSKSFTNNFTADGNGNSENRGAFRLDHGCSISGNITLTGDTSFGNNVAATTSTISGVISGIGFGARTAATGNGTIALSGPNTYSGRTTIAGQTAFSVSSINNNGNTGNLGTNGTIDFGDSTTSGTLIYTGNGETNNRIINLAGTTGGALITQSGSTGLLKITGGVTASGMGAKTLTLSGSTFASGEISGTIADHDSANKTTVTKTGTGTWTLSGNNTHTGGTNASGGQLIAANPGALGPAGTAASLASSDSILELATDSTLNPIDINQASNTGNTTLRLSRATPGPAFNHTLANLNLGTTNQLTIEAGANITSGPPSVSFALWQINSATGNSTLNPTTASIALGGITIPSGDTNKTAVLDGTSSGNLISGPISSGPLPGAVLSIVKSNSGTWTLSGANTHNGSTSINGGTLRLDYSSPAKDNSKLADTATLTLGGGTLELSGGTHPETVGSTILTAGRTSNIIRNSGNAILQMNAVTANVGSQAVFNADGIAMTTSSNVNGILHWARVIVAGTPVLATNSGGSIIAYSAFTNVNRLGGAIPDGIANNIRIIEAGTSGNITLAAAPLTKANFLQNHSTGGTAAIAPASSTDILMIGDQTGGTIWQPAPAGGLAIGSTANDGILTSGNTSNNSGPVLNFLNDSIHAITVNSVIANNGTDIVAIGKGGSGSLILAGNNTFTGSVTAAAGSLLMSGNNSFTGILTASPGATVTLSGNNSARPTGTNGRTVISNGGTLQLQASTGNTSAGVCSALAAEQTANQPLLLNNGGLLQLRSDTSLTFSGANNLGGLGGANVTIDVNPLTSATGQTITLAPAGFNVNTTTINATGGNGYTLATGVINSTSGSSVLTLNPTTAAMSIAGYTANTSLSTTLALGGSAANNAVTGTIANPPSSGTTTLTKSGPGTWSLHGVNTFTGNITINAGTLTIGSNGNLDSGNYQGNIINNGMFIHASSAAQNLDGAISGNGALTMHGGSVLTIGGASANTYTGVTTLNSGITSAGKPSAFGAAGPASGTIINSTALLNINSQNLGAETFILAGGSMKNNGTTDQHNAVQNLSVIADSLIGGDKRWDIRSGSPGGLTINPGTKLTKLDANQISVVSNPILNNGNIQINAGIFALHLGTTSTGTGSYQINSSGELQIGSYGTPSTIANTITISGGTLTAADATGGNSSCNGTITLSPSSTATLHASSSFNITAPIAGAGSLNKTGSGTLTISAASSYSGNTSVTAGLLSFSIASSFDDSSAIRLTTGATLHLGVAGTDTVAELHIDNTKQPDGKWGRTGSIAALGADHESALITGDGLLNVSANNPYSAWALTKSLDGSPGKENGLTDDPDKDGKTNLHEFAFDGNPISGTNEGKVIAKVATVGGNPVFTLTVPVRTGTTFTGTTEQVSPLIDGIIYRIQGSDSPAATSWNLAVTEVPAVDAAAIQAGLPDLSDTDNNSTPDWIYKTFRSPGTISDGDPRDFLRAGAGQ